MNNENTTYSGNIPEFNSIDTTAVNKKIIICYEIN
jgi:hypothetical protein